MHPMVENQEVRGSRRVRFTDASIRALPAGDGRPTDYSDAVQRGLRLRVSPSGERIFLLAYRKPATGVGVKISLGSLAQGLSLAQARKEAADLLAGLRREPPVDPGQERARRRETAKARDRVTTFSDACDAFACEELPTFRPATAAGWRRYLEREIKPALGRLKPEEITVNDIAELRAGIERGGPERKPAPVSARRCHEVLRRILVWLSAADPEGAHVRKRYGLQRLEVNPADAARSFHRRRRNGSRAETSAKAYTDVQLRAISAAAEPEGAFGNLLALIAYTSVRAHDARAARWEDVDLDRKLWSISQHKTSDHTGAPHVVPLSEGALTVLARTRLASLAAGFEKSDWVFPAPTGPCEVCREPGHLGKDQKAAERLKTAASLAGRGVLHRMRDTIKTRMSEHGIDGRASEAILSHVPPGMVGVYDHRELLPQRREALEWWSGELARILATPPEKGTGETAKVARNRKADTVEGG